MAVPRAPDSAPFALKSSSDWLRGGGKKEKRNRYYGYRIDGLELKNRSNSCESILRAKRDVMNRFAFVLILFHDLLAVYANVLST